MSMFEMNSKKKFCIAVQDLVLRKKITYLDSVIQVCEEWEIEPELAAKFLDEPIIDRIEQEAIDLHYLPRHSEGVLPV